MKEITENPLVIEMTSIDFKRLFRHIDKIKVRDPKNELFYIENTEVKKWVETNDNCLLSFINFNKIIFVVRFLLKGEYKTIRRNGKKVKRLYFFGENQYLYN